MYTPRALALIGVIRICPLLSKLASLELISAISKGQVTCRDDYSPSCRCHFTALGNQFRLVLQAWSEKDLKSSLGFNADVAAKLARCGPSQLLFLFILLVLLQAGVGTTPRVRACRIRTAHRCPA